MFASLTDSFQEWDACFLAGLICKSAALCLTPHLAFPRATWGGFGPLTTALSVVREFIWRLAPGNFASGTVRGRIWVKLALPWEPSPICNNMGEPFLQKGHRFLPLPYIQPSASQNREEFKVFVSSTFLLNLAETGQRIPKSLRGD